MQYKYGEIRQVEKSLDDPEDGFISSKIFLNVFLNGNVAAMLGTCPKSVEVIGNFSTVGSGLGL